MAVLVVDRALDESAVINRQNLREYTDQYWAQVSPGTSRVDILTDPRVPKPWSRHPEDPLAFCTTVRPTLRAGTDDLYDIEVQYSTEVEADPLSRRPAISWDSVEGKRIRTIDSEGKPALNTAGDLLEGLEEDVSRWVINFQRNVAFIPGWVRQYADAVNADEVVVDGETFPVGTLKLKGLKIGDWQRENDVDFRSLSFQLHHQDEGWAMEVLNRGLQERVLKTVRQNGAPRQVWVKVRILDDKGEPVTEPQFLDRDGRRPQDGQGNIKTELDPEDIVVLKFNFTKKLPFSALPLR